PNLHRRRRDSFDLLRGGGLRPGEGVEDGVGCVAKPGTESRAARRKPRPVALRLKNAERVVVGKSETREGRVRVNGTAQDEEDGAFRNACTHDVTREGIDSSHEFPAPSL